MADVGESYKRTLDAIARNAYGPGDTYFNVGKGKYSGPMPSYFKGRQADEGMQGVRDSAYGVGGAIGSLLAPEALALFGPTSAVGFAGSMAHGSAADDARKAAEMWANTGMPQRPTMSQVLRGDAPTPPMPMPQQGMSGSQAGPQMAPQPINSVEDYYRQMGIDPSQAYGVRP
jgi:hypothetical protein